MWSSRSPSQTKLGPHSAACAIDSARRQAFRWPQPPASVLPCRSRSAPQPLLVCQVVYRPGYSFYYLNNSVLRTAANIQTFSQRKMHIMVMSRWSSSATSSTSEPLYSIGPQSVITSLVESWWWNKREMRHERPVYGFYAVWLGMCESNRDKGNRASMMALWKTTTVSSATLIEAKSL